MIKAGLIGIGAMGSGHFQQYNNLKDVQLVAVADVRVDMAREKVAGTDINVYESLDELLANESVDMVDICTPSYMHADHAIKALNSGVHVLCEKPMSLSSADTKRMREAAERSGKMFMTAHVVRFMRPYIYLKSVIDSGELGRPVHIDMKRLSEFPTWSWENWMGDVTKSGGTPIDLSIHDIDFAQYAFGQPKEVSGVYKKLENNNDYIVSNLVYDGFDVNITGAWFNYKIPFRAEYIAVFENGCVELKDGKVTKNGEEVELEKSEAMQVEGFNVTNTDGYGAEILYFTECLKNNVKPEMVTPESSENSVKLVERILENCISVL